MKAEKLMGERRPLDQHSSVKLAVWRLSAPLPGSAHPFKYSLAYVVDGVCVLRYDNERGKGDHRHLGDVETVYSFTTIEQLEQDFWRDVESLR